MSIIYHMTTREAWTAVDPEKGYQPPSLGSEGFIHLSTSGQILGVANGLYHGQRDSVILCVDELKVRAEIVYEDCYETGQDFPHIYGPLFPTAVVKVIDFPCDEAGNFSLPPELRPDELA